jgi:hypothetical protein
MAKLFSEDSRGKGTETGNKKLLNMATSFSEASRGKGTETGNKKLLNMATVPLTSACSTCQRKKV